jgi:hypothetical protein
MKDGIILLRHSLKRFRGLLVGAGIILATFQILFSFAAVSLQQSDSIGVLAALIPAPIREVLGPGLITMISFSGIVCLGYFHVALIGLLSGVITAVATEPAGELESRFLDLLLSRPVPRIWIILRSSMLTGLSTCLLVGAMGIGSAAGLSWLAPEHLSLLKAIRLLVYNLSFLMLAWGGIALALASAARRRAFPATITGSLMVSTYLLDYLARVWEPARRICWLSPFHYYDPVSVIGSASLPARHLWILGTIAVASTALALALFSHRDL